MKTCLLPAFLLLSSVALQAALQPTPWQPADVQLDQVLTRSASESTLSFQIKAIAAPTSALTLDTSSRRASRNFYNAIYPVSDGIDSGWNGSIANGIPGTTTQEFQDAIVLRINWLRALAGVPAVITLNPTWNALDQQAALMGASNNNISHNPPTSWINYTAGGAQAAGSSNLSLGQFGPDAMTGYVSDGGSNNTVAGHRRWLLYPPTKRMGTGDVPATSGHYSANALWIFDTANPYPTVRDGFVAWPPKGFVPYQMIFPRWSFSLQNANFASATVTVTKDGVAVGTTISNATTTGVGDPSLVWTLAGAPDGTTFAKPTADSVYAVNIAGVVVGGVSKSFSYTVTVFDPAVTGPDDIAPTFSGTGTASVTTGSTTTFPFTLVPEATNYEIWTGTMITPTWSDGAETSPSTHVTTETTGTYSPVSSTVAATGTKSYQLCQDQFLSQDLLLNATFLPSSISYLSFKSRLGYMTSDQVARVQVSTDDGESWITLFSRPGTQSDSGSFTGQNVDLSAYAGRLIHLRFQLYFPGSGSAFTQTGGTFGWLIDDIAPVNIQEVKSSTVKAVTAGTASFTAPTAAASMALAVRGYLFGAFPLEYGPVKLVQVKVPTTTAPVITSALTASASVGKAFTYAITATNTPTSFSAVSLPAGLSLDTTTGIISGTPTGVKVATVTLYASNAAGKGMAKLTLTVAKGAQKITFPVIGSQVYPRTAFTLKATSSSGLNVAYAVTGPAKLSGVTLTLTGVGTVSIVASQAGNANYLAAPNVTRTFTVTAKP